MNVKERIWTDTYVIPSNKHFIIFCFFLSSLLIRETQPVLNCLSSFANKKK